MSSADIYALIIPIHYKLKKEEIAALVEAENDTAFEDILSKTYYGKHYEMLSPDTIEDMYIYIMKHILTKESRRDPYSVCFHVSLSLL